MSFTGVVVFGCPLTALLPSCCSQSVTSLVFGQTAALASAVIRVEVAKVSRVKCLTQLVNILTIISARQTMNML